MKKFLPRFLRCTEETPSAWERLMLLKAKKHEVLLSVLITALILCEIASVVVIFLYRL